MFFPFLMLVFSEVHLSSSVGLKKLGRFLDNFFPQQQNAMGSLHNIDFGVFWASWGGSGFRRFGSQGSESYFCFENRLLYFEGARLYSGCILFYFESVLLYFESIPTSLEGAL